MRRCKLRFGLLGPPVLYDRPPHGISHATARGASTGAPGGQHPVPGAADSGSSGSGNAGSGDAGFSDADSGNAGSGSAGLGRADSGSADSYEGTGAVLDIAPDHLVHSIGSPKVRALLAALLLEAGRVVSVDALKDALWGGAPPVSAQASLHNHVTRLRRLLDDPERLRAVSPGYLLRVDDGELDVHVFDTRVVEARAAHARRDWAGVVRACAAGLGLWRGTPLSGLPADLGGYALVQRLEEARLLLLEWRYDAELALGGARTAGLVPELAALVAEHPLREAYHRQLMLALHRTGRQAEALAVHRDLRARLIEELGVEPGHAVREAHLEVLRTFSPPRSDGPAAGPAPLPSHRPTDHPSADGAPSSAHGGPAPHSAPAPAAGRPVSPSPNADLSRNADLSPDPDLRPDPSPRSPADAVPPVHGAPTAHGAPPAHAAPTADGAPPAPGPPAHADAGPTLHVAPGRTGAEPALRGAPPSGDGGSTPHGTRAAAAATSAAGTPAGAAPVTQGPPVTQGSPAVQGPPAPAQLPPAPAIFAGRAAELRELQQTLATRESRLAVISGMAGVGKSALALHVSHALRERFPDGQLYINLHGATPGMPPLSTSQALTSLLRDLGAEPRNIPEHPDAAAALLRSLLAPARILLVLDDAASAAQVRPLLPAGPGCAVIVTSRSPLTALDGARRFPLGPLSGEDSAALLRAVSGREGLHADHALVELTGRLPLALRVVAARLAARRALTPEVLAGQLAATEGRLHHLEYDDLSVRRSLAVAHDALAAAEREADRDAALVLRRIGALDLSTYGAPLIARLTGTDERRAEAALDRLVDVALLEETSYGRYTPHDLVRDFARELAGKSPEQATDADLIALRWYAAVAERVLVAIVEPGLDQEDRRRPTAAEPPEHAADVAALTTFESADMAFAWGEVELENIVALVERNADTADERRAAHLSALVRLFFPYVQRSGRVAEMEVLGQAALGTARRLGDAPAEAYALVDLAGLNFLTGRQNDALALTDRALVIWQQLGRVSWIRRSLNNRGLLLEGLGRFAESGEALRQSLGYSRRLNDPYGEAVTYSHLGNLYEHIDPRAAIDQHRRSLAIGDAIGAVIVQHSAHCNIGYAHLTLGEPAAAARHFEESLRILGGHGDWHGESRTRLGLVRALRQLGESERAGHECAELLHRADARADRYIGGLARHQHGFLLRERGRQPQAYDTWRAARAALDGTDEQMVLEELRELLDGGSAP
ncbi:BTAD domain-containing putative transcriptional regulator [Streptomyces sp. NPDC007971]|uniref:AfsR/SARP family transcriptional regulator n=1 Tax=Streptomyces sp. NPDC007971 TaxID=3364799 RepID=UPI0036E6D3B5